MFRKIIGIVGIIAVIGTVVMVVSEPRKDGFCPEMFKFAKSRAAVEATLPQFEAAPPSADTLPGERTPEPIPDSLSNE